MAESSLVFIRPPARQGWEQVLALDIFGPQTYLCSIRSETAIWREPGGPKVNGSEKVSMMVVVV